MVKNGEKQTTTKAGMVKNGKADNSAKQVKKILITQPRPESDKSPYYELSRKYSLELDFHPFIRLEPIPGKEFRKQKIEIQNYTGVIFTASPAARWPPRAVVLDSGLSWIRQFSLCAPVRCIR